MKLDNNGYEEVNEICKNGHILRVGDALSCSCKYEVARLSPVWHGNSKIHWKDHPNNSFMYRMIVSDACPLHSKCK
jgi:hypothetical protein